MKREIYCEQCLRSLVDKFGVSLPTDPLLMIQRSCERVLIRRGLTKHDMVCDLCNKDLPTKTSAAAVSFVGMGQKFFEWAHDYLRIAIIIIAIFLCGCETRRCLKSHTELKYQDGYAYFVPMSDGNLIPLYQPGYFYNEEICDRYGENLW